MGPESSYEMMATTCHTTWCHNTIEHRLILAEVPRDIPPENILTVKDNPEKGNHEAQKHNHLSLVESTLHTAPWMRKLLQKLLFLL
jgi:hypothetical protein